MTAQRRALEDAVVIRLSALKQGELLERHLDNVTTAALKLGRRLELNGEELDVLRFAALLFDVGKVDFWDSVMLKLDERE